VPQVTVYIREEDIEKWKTIQRKSEFIHKALNTSKPIPQTEGVLRSDSRVPMTLDNPFQITKEPLNKSSKDYSLCKHGSVKGFCKIGC
jgi:hypothetical protein